MTWPRRWHVAAVLLALWVLAANVFVSFPRARTRLVETPLPPRQRVVLPLVEAVRTPGDRLVLVCRLRNLGPGPVTVSASVGDRVLRDVQIAPGVSKRFDLAWGRPATPLPTDTLELAGSSGTWVVEYAELANLHGYTVGAVEFLILPAAQPFQAPPRWSWALFAGLLMLVFCARPHRWRFSAHAAHATLSALVAFLFLAAALSPFVSQFRVVLSVHTFVLGLVAIWLPQELDLIARALRALTPAALAVARRVRGLPGARSRSWRVSPRTRGCSGFMSGRMPVVRIRPDTSIAPVSWRIGGSARRCAPSQIFRPTPSTRAPGCRSDSRATDAMRWCQRTRSASPSRSLPRPECWDGRPLPML